MNKSCGKVSQDIPGTLAGAWYHEDVPIDEQGNYTQQLTFAHDAGNLQTAIISVGGTFGETALCQSNVSADSPGRALEGLRGGIPPVDLSEIDRAWARQRSQESGCLMGLRRQVRNAARPDVR